jgi:hypothetical protein
MRKIIIISFVFIVSLSCFPVSHAQMTGPERSNWLLGVIFKLENMRDKAIADIQKYEGEIQKCDNTINKSENIVRLAQQKGNVQAETIAREASIKAQEAKKKFEENKREAEASRALAEEDLQRYCKTIRVTRQRLASGLPVEREAIKRTEAAIKAAKTEIFSAKAEMATVSIDAVRTEVFDFAGEYVSTSKDLRAMLKDLKTSKTTRDRLIHSLGNVIKSGDDVMTAAGEGYKTGNNLQKDMQNAVQYLEEANRLFVESGIAGECGETLSEAILGQVLGKYTFRGAQLSINLGAAYGHKKISESERSEEEKNLNIMYSQYQRVEEMIVEMDKNLEQYCK